MSYPTFPSIQPYSYQENIQPEDPGITTQMADGSEVSRARFSKSRLSYTRHWNAMPDADKAILLNFYQNMLRGSSQICTWNGVNGRIINPPTFQRVGGNLWAVELTFREA